MTNIYLLSIVLIQFYSSEVRLLLLQEQFLSRQLDLTKFIEFPYGQKCLQIALNSRNHPRLSIAAADNVSVHMLSHISLQLRNISTEQEGYCQTFLIFADSIDIVKTIFEPKGSSMTQFFPFTKIYFYLNNQDNYRANLESMSLAREFLIENALFGYVFEYSDEHYDFRVIIRDLLTNDVKNTMESYTPTYLLHPMVNTKLAKKNFRISLFNCAPYTIYLTTGPYEASIDKMDGTEFRFVQDVTKNWKKSFKFRDFSQVKANPYQTVMLDLQNKTSDMAMCALWLTEDSYKRYDLSTYYEKQCVVFMVPKPRKLHEATAIYTTLDTLVWLLFFFLFVSSTFLLHAIAKAEKDLNDSTSVFTSLTSAFMETVNTATLHGVQRFPTNQTSVKILLTSWILLSFLLGIGYTTIYVSRLASPSYEKPINTVKQVLDYGLYVCNPYLDESAIAFRTSINADYRELGYRTIVYGENAQYRRRLFVERKCAVSAVRLTANYVGLIKFKDDFDLLPIFRTTKNCITNSFSVFAFQKYSPFTKLFNWHIRRYQEHGITRKWKSDILQTPKPMRTLFQDQPKDTGHHRITLLNLSGAFFLLGIGLLFSMLQFFIEHMKYRRNSI